MHFKPKKKLGQNFLIDKNIQRKIIDSCMFKACDIVLEIGAGQGQLTRLIADKVKMLYAIELDPGCLNDLSKNLEGLANTAIIKGDILRFNLKKYFRKSAPGLKVVGNIPYYITTPIIELLLSFKDRISTIFITLQKEFAERMAAHPYSKDYGAFSCFVQYHTDPKIIFRIKKTSFYPSPKVDSAFVRLDIKQESALGKKEEKLLFEIIRAAFNKRRKTLRNSLRDKVPLDLLNIFFNHYNINPDTRPEDLSLQDFISLVKIHKV